MTTKIREMISVLEEAERGKVVEFRSLTSNTRTWTVLCPVDDNSQWDFTKYEYRIQPKPREFWILDSFVFNTEKAAIQHSANSSDIHTHFAGIIHVKEVLP